MSSTNRPFTPPTACYFSRRSECPGSSSGRQNAVLEHLKAGFSRRGQQTGWEPAEEPFLSACSFCFQKHSPQRFGGLCYRERDTAGLGSPLLGTPTVTLLSGCAGPRSRSVHPSTWMDPHPMPSAPVPLHSITLLISFLGLTLFYFTLFYL